MRQTLTIVTTALLVVLAGCGGGMGGQTATPVTDTSEGTDTETAATPETATATTAANVGRVNFYVSDQANAIGDFEHLNATITSVGVVAAGAANETDGDDTETSGWVVRDVNATVDLTRLQGENATLLRTLPVPDGEYEKAVLSVSDVSGTLTSGEETAVKLPSERLQVNSAFAVGENETVDFVFDIAVHEAGGSGKYVIRPVVSESGTDVPIREIDEKRATVENRTQTRMEARLLGTVASGERVTVRVRRGEGPVANATVTVNGERSGATNATGEHAFIVPDGNRLTVTVRDGEESLTLRRALKGEKTAKQKESNESAGPKTPTNETASND